MFVAFNKKNVITAVSGEPFSVAGHTVTHLPDDHDWPALIGTRLPKPKKPADQLRVALVCNWDQPCGISTYSKFLADALRPKIAHLQIFDEGTHWHRGKPLKPLADALLAYKPDYTIIQHEFGLFPKAGHFLQLMQALDDTPHAVVMHSVYEHLDKTVCTSACKNIIVHSAQAKAVLTALGHTGQIAVIPHGCTRFPDRQELWNIFQTPYALVQFGFGFNYKGVDRVLDALALLKKDPKFQDIFYVYLCSENPHTNNVHQQYHDFLTTRIDQLGLHENTAIIRKYQSDQTINNYLRTAKIALFPYTTDPKNTVYGASGALRIAMANGIPVVASTSHLFDDLDGIVPRPHDAPALALAIDHIFSNHDARNNQIIRQDEYLNNNTWDITADRYLDVLAGLK